MRDAATVARLGPHADQLSLDHAAYLLNAALEADRKRRWWEPPNRLWVGRVEMALGIVTRASEAIRGS